MDGNNIMIHAPPNSICKQGAAAYASLVWICEYPFIYSKQILGKNECYTYFCAYQIDDFRINCVECKKKNNLNG